MTVAGLAMLLLGTGLLVWFFRRSKRHDPEMSPLWQVEWMVMGALLVSIGLLLTLLGTVGGTCRDAGIT
jgi:uncharacterized membrane protein